MDLTNLRRKYDYLENDAPPWLRVLIKSRPSMDWFIKSHSQHLELRGAIVKLGREWFIIADKFEPVVRELYHLPPLTAAENKEAA